MNNLTQFIAEAASGNGFLRPNQFDLAIPGMPKWSQGAYDGRTVEFRCNSASLPGVNIDSIDIRRYGSGFLEYFPTGASFYDLQTTFYADQNAEIIRFFNAWVRNIVDFDVDTGPENKFRVFYRDNYISQVSVNQYNTEGDVVLSYTYIDAFPVAIQPIGVRWFSRDEVTEFEVTWKYRTWKETANPLAPLPGSDFTNVLGLPLPSQITGLPGVSVLQERLPNVQTVLGANPSVQNVVNKIPNVQSGVRSVLSVFGR